MNTRFNSERILSTIDKLGLTIIGILGILFLYLPYSRILSLFLQIIITIILILFIRRPSLFFPAIMVLTVTQSYIFNSTKAEFSNYYSINTLLFLILLFIYSFGNFIFQKNNGKSKWVNILLTVFGTFMLSSILWAYTYWEYSNIFLLICLLYIFAPKFINNEKDFLIIEIGYILSGMIYSVGVLPHIISKGDMYKYVVLGDRNYISCFILTNIFITALFVFRHYKNIKKIPLLFCAISLILNCALLLLTGSRSGFIVLIFGCTLLLFQNIKKFKAILGVTIFIAVMMIIIVQYGLLNTVLSRLQEENISTANGRLDIVQLYINDVLNSNVFNIIFGHGFVSISKMDYVAHNSFVSILFCFGIIGLLCYVGVIFNCIKELIKTGNSLFLIALISMLLMSITIEPYYRVEFVLFFILICKISAFPDSSPKQFRLM